MRLIYYGDGPWAALSLKQIVAAGHDVPAVVVRSKTADTTLVEAAKELNLPVLCPDKVNAPEFLQKVRELAPDLNVSVSYDQILRHEIITSAPLGFINIHAGKLPFYRGRNIINWAIINGETEIGLTVHYVNEDIDTGDIIVQRVMPIAWEDTYAEVLQCIIDAVPDTIMEAIRLVGEGKAPRRSQEKFQGTYYASRINGDEWIDWTDTSRNIYNKIRAITRPGRPHLVGWKARASLARQLRSVVAQVHRRPRSGCRTSRRSWSHR